MSCYWTWTEHKYIWGKNVFPQPQNHIHANKYTKKKKTTTTMMMMKMKENIDAQNYNDDNNITKKK